MSLDQLLKLPDEDRYTVERRGNYTEKEWREMFVVANTALEREKVALDLAEEKLEGVARTKSNWNVGPSIPGIQTNNSNAPMDYQLSKEIKARRAEVERLEKVIRELEVEADLVGVPEEWRS